MLGCFLQDIENFLFHENYWDGPAGRLKTWDWKTWDHIAGVENAELENEGPNRRGGKRRTGKRGTKSQGWKTQHWKTRDQTCIILSSGRNLLFSVRLFFRQMAAQTVN